MITIEQFNAAKGARYGNPPHDGAMYKCVDCGERMWPQDCYLVATPEGNKSVICKVCIDDDWCRLAQYYGQLV